VNIEGGTILSVGGGGVLVGGCVGGCVGIFICKIFYI
jgi:hypothetical protein